MTISKELLDQLVKFSNSRDSISFIKCSDEDIKSLLAEGAKIVLRDPQKGKTTVHYQGITFQNTVPVVQSIQEKPRTVAEQATA